MEEAKLPRKPVPEDFGMTFNEYEQARREYARPRKERPVPEAKFWLPFCATAGACWACAYIFSQLSGGRDSVIVTALSGAPFIIVPIWFVVSEISLAREEFQRARRGDIYEPEPAHLRPLFEKLRLYERSLATYQQVLSSYNQIREQYWKSLRGTKLEDELAIIYRRFGYVVETTKATGDEGIDLVLRRDGRTIIVQCKGHHKPIGVGAVRDLYGTLMHHGADRAVLACPMGFTEGVKDFVKGKPIDLISASQLAAMAESAKTEQAGREPKWVVAKA